LQLQRFYTDNAVIFVHTLVLKEITIDQKVINSSSAFAAFLVSSAKQFLSVSSFKAADEFTGTQLRGLFVEYSVVRPTANSNTTNNTHFVINQNPQPGKLGVFSFKPGFTADNKELNMFHEIQRTFAKQIDKQTNLESLLLGFALQI
jgi:hypothetical protein